MAEILLHEEAAPPDSALLERLAALSTAALSDSMERLSGAPGLMPVAWNLPSGARMAGPALTVRTPPGDNLAIHKAVDLARPGDVLVVDAWGYSDRAVVGGLLVRYARAQGIAGLVIHGAVRDLADLVELGLPVFARAVTHVGPYKNGPGELRGPVGIGGTVVAQGDVVVGDEDGVVVVPQARLAEVSTGAETLVEKERAAVAAIDAGRWERPWVDALIVRDFSTANRETREVPT
jgi:regulator of RNase E activity RraA